MEIVHASAAAFGTNGVLIVGNSGSGKTTLLLELLQNGATFVADDAVPLFIEDGGLSIACPGFPIAHSEKVGFIDIRDAFGSETISETAYLRLIVLTGNEELFVRNCDIAERLVRIPNRDFSELDLTARVNLVKEFFNNFNG